MKTVKLNIGLENNPFDFERVKTLFNPLSARIEVGEYNGQVERTAVINALIDGSIETIFLLIDLLTIAFTQECIAVKIDDVGYLVYNPNFDGEKFEFDNQYFIEP